MLQRQEWPTLQAKAEARLFPLVCGVHYEWTDEGVITLLNMPSETVCDNTAITLRALIAHPEYNGIDASIGRPYRVGTSYRQDIRVSWKSLSQP